MRLVGFDEFCRMPAGTIFAPYEPLVTKECLAVKTDTGEDMPEDYPYCRHSFLGVMPLEPWLDDKCELWKIGDSAPASFEIYDGSSSDYMDDELFLVLDSDDVDRMINVLMWAKNGCEGPCDCSVEEE
jgi:hypothetical protein